jgi:hypothetical protein
MRMASRAGLEVFVLFLLSAVPPPVQGQARPIEAMKASIRTATEENQSLAAGVLKEIDDSCTGDRWLLVRAADHPEGPGRLVRITRSGRIVQTGDSEEAAPAVRERAAVPVIRTGDTLVLEESTPLVEARLEARALGPAICGAEFNARLAIGGKVVRAVALGKGRAAFVVQAGIRP